MNIEQRRWYKVKEIAAFLNVSEKGLYRACSQKLIPCSKPKGIGLRIDKLKLDALLDGGDLPAMSPAPSVEQPHKGNPGRKPRR